MIGQETRWIRQTLEGDTKAFSKLVKKYRDAMFYLAYNLCGNEDDAKDIAQEAFIKAFKQLRQFKGNAQFSTWMHRITINQTYDHLRRQSGYRHVAISDNDIQTTPDDSNSEPDDQMQNALNHLSFKQRQVVVLKYYHNYSYEEISELMACTQSTVRNHMLRAMKQLRHILTRSNEKKEHA